MTLTTQSVDTAQRSDRERQIHAVPRYRGQIGSVSAAAVEELREDLEIEEAAVSPLAPRHLSEP
jgi:hypothetical protein